MLLKGGRISVTLYVDCITNKVYLYDILKIVFRHSSLQGISVAQLLELFPNISLKCH